MTFGEFLDRVANQLDSLPERLGGHIGLSLAALSLGILISVPLGIWAARRKRIERITVTMASIIQTVPSLALLALMVFVFGKIGWFPAWIALILYSILPMLRNTITGLQGIDPALREAASGIGMNARQMLFSVELPLALPSIVAGIRTASVWVVGAATLAQPIGATSLGNYIFVGLQTSNFVAMLFGCFFSALLAIAFDVLLRGMESAARQRSLKSAILVGGGLLLVCLAPLLVSVFRDAVNSDISRVETIGSLDDREDNEPFVIGSKPFTEQYILLELLKRRLADQGVRFKAKDGMGSAMVLNALASGELDCFIDYTGTIWSNIMQRETAVAPVEMLVDVASYLKSERNIICLGPLGFSNDYAFAMKRRTTTNLKITTLADLAKRSKNLRVAADVEFFGRPEWRDVQRRYGMDFDREVSMDSTLMYGAIANDEIDVVVAYTTDARIDAYDLVVLEDPLFVLPPYDAVLLVSKRMARHGAAMQALRPLIQSISTKLMRRSNGLVDMEKRTVQDACDLLNEENRTSTQ